MWMCRQALSGSQTWLFPLSIFCGIFLLPTSYMSRDSWPAGHRTPPNLPQGPQNHHISKWIDHFLPTQICSCISILTDEIILSHQLPKLQSWEPSFTSPSNLPWSCGFYFINTFNTHPFLWILCHRSGPSLHHVFCRLAIASLPISLLEFLKGDATGILAKEIVHLYKMLPASYNF